MCANKPIEEIGETLLASTKSALDELVWWATRRWRRKPLERCEARIERIEGKSTARRRHDFDFWWWPIASFRCDAEVDRYRGIADPREPSARPIYGFTA
jgi:hypothetical protein